MQIGSRKLFAALDSQAHTTVGMLLQQKESKAGGQNKAQAAN